MDKDLKFFTNEPERDLYGKFQSLLKGNVIKFMIWLMRG